MKRVKSVVVENIKNKKYRNILINKKIMKNTMKRIRIELIKIGTHKACKISSSCFDDKRYILDDGINSLTYFNNF